jgi:catechol 2,3-dioxygenase-like lactoylglutathione lyase family enzyme
MINGAHVVVYCKDAEADRAFFRDILGFTSVDAGNGWLIFGLRRLSWPSTLPRQTTDMNST